MVARVLIVLVVLGVAGSASAQSVEPTLPRGYGDDTTELATQNFSLWLEHYASQAEGPRITTAVLAIAVGVAVVPFEGWLLSSIDLRSSANTDLVILAGAGLALAVLDISLGILQLARPSLPEQRFERWRARRAAGPMTARELGRFEGEIRGELAQVQDARWASLAMGIGLSCASIIGFGLTAGLADSGTGQLLGYVTSGAIGLVGLVFAVFPWFFDQPERDWQQIDSGNPPLAFAPWGSPDGGGLALSGGF